MTLRPAIVCKEFAMASALGSMAFGRWIWLLGAFPLAAAEDVLNVLFMATWMVWDSRAVGGGLWFECCAWKPGGDDKDQIGTYFNQPIISSLVWGMEQPKSSFWATKQFIGGSIEGQIPTFAAKRCLSLVSRVTWVISPSSSVHFLAVKMQVVITMPVSETLPDMCSFPIWGWLTPSDIKADIGHSRNHADDLTTPFPMGKCAYEGAFSLYEGGLPRGWHWKNLGNPAATSPFWWVYGSCYSLLLSFYHD